MINTIQNEKLIELLEEAVTVRMPSDYLFTFKLDEYIGQVSISNN